MQLSDLTFSGDNSRLVPRQLLETPHEPGKHKLPESGPLTVKNPNINIHFVPKTAGNLRYAVRVNGSIEYEHVYRVCDSQVGSPVIVWGVAHYDFDSASDNQACEIILELENSWLIARF
ncbi:hypothetical protein FHS42_006062 [Streptomyces zagrosensis]|uniref:Uncharacterized protein n=1 Tax=Streptomyces zagrosensis TaxID=1042984 RepID=A0A7W9V1A0_9ACTN|nr:hypothetical protein [Streptomyces zagrosensis]